MNTIITKLLSQLVGDGILLKTLGAILIAAMSLAGLFLKLFYDIDTKTGHIESAVDHLCVDNTILHKNIGIVNNNIDLLMKHNNIVAEDSSYWQYITFKNFFYFTLTIGTIVGCVCLYQTLLSNQAQINVLTSQIDTIKNMFQTINTSNQDISKDGTERVVNLCKEISKMVGDLKNYTEIVDSENTNRLGLPVSNKIIAKARTVVWDDE
jgi:hypothetical protein